MPLYEVQGAETLIPFRRLLGSADLYESEIEELLWNNLEEFTGEALFRIARRPAITGGGIPDVVALDRTARVVVIEIKRDVERGQLAQCLEYAGWARTTNLDELSSVYYRGPDAFFNDWRDFTESTAPLRVQRAPRLMLVARDFHGRTYSAFEFLTENRVPIKLISVSVYEDQGGRRFIDVEGGHEPEFPARAESQSESTSTDDGPAAGRAVRLADLLDAGLMAAGQALAWERPRIGTSYRATLLENASIRLEDGRVFSSPSGAAMAAANIPSYDGWYAWKTERGESLHDLRTRLLDQEASK